ncbi:MAG: hypothetical protein GQ527_07090 [Bacteroidales bacterium]|nr:hypothetical protein [Bacteroidales bacterium]
MSVKNWLNKPYPFIVDLKMQLLVSFGFGLFIYLFLLVFQPFGIENVATNKYIYLIGFGIITLVVMLVFFIILPQFFKRLFDIDQWNIEKEILFILLILFFISLLNYEYNSIVGNGFAQPHTLLYFILITLVVGLFPILILVFLTEIYLRQKHEKAAFKLSSIIQKERNNSPLRSQLINIVSDSKNPPLSMKQEELLFIKSEDNYCSVNYLLDGKMNTTLIRVTLKNLVVQLEAFPDMIRCHRSHIVNKKNILRISGNARAYNLHFEHTNETLAVSRGFPKNSLL